MEQIKESIYNNIAEIVESFNCVLVDMVVRGVKNNPVIELYVDNEKGISTEDCADISRKVEEYLESEAKDAVSAKYRLDVSSPGISRPIKYVIQLPKHVGREFEISFELNGEIKNKNAKLTEVDGDKLTFVSGRDEFQLVWSDVKQANVIISF